MCFATVNGIQVYYETLGEGEPLLLINGQGGDHHGWDLVRDGFASRYHVIVWDHRGTGQSDKPREPAYSIGLFASDATGLLDHLGIPRAHAYGVSMGGRICQRLGIDHASRLGALVLGCTTPGNAHGVRRPAEVDARMANRPADPEQAAEFLLDQMVTPGYVAKHPEYHAAMMERLRNPIPPYAQRMHYLASEGHEAWDELPLITAPTLVIHGSDDHVNPTANAALLAARIPGAELRIIHGGRHGYFIEFAEEATTAVLDFLAGHPLQDD